MTKNEIKQGVIALEKQLQAVEELLSEADQREVYLIRSRFTGLINAYKNDDGAIAILTLLMAEFGIKARMKFI